MKVAVVAHSGKTLGGGLARAAPRARGRGGHRPVLGRGAEEPEGTGAGPSARSTAGAELIFAWGGDGMVQRCVDVLAGTRA